MSCRVTQRPVLRGYGAKERTVSFHGRMCLCRIIVPDKMFKMFFIKVKLCQHRETGLRDWLSRIENFMEFVYWQKGWFSCLTTSYYSIRPDGGVIEKHLDVIRRVYLIEKGNSEVSLLMLDLRQDVLFFPRFPHLFDQMTPRSRLSYYSSVFIPFFFAIQAPPLSPPPPISPPSPSPRKHQVTTLQYMEGVASASKIIWAGSVRCRV